MANEQLMHPTREALVGLVEAASRAPSSHNTQPWRFRVGTGRIVLRADTSRALPVGDPDGRELTISCGAALFNLAVAARQAGLDPVIDYLPDGETGAPLATVTLAPGPVADPDLYQAMNARHTTRGPLLASPVNDDLLATLTSIAAEHDAWLLALEPAQHGPIADLIAEGDRIQFANRHWRAELASWMHPRSRGDGLVVPPLAGPFIRASVTALNVGARTAAKDHVLAHAAPVLAVLGTNRDRQLDWIHAGEALEHVLLHAAGHGVQAGFLNQPCQVDQLRTRLADLINRDGSPQLILRLGQPLKPLPAAPRRYVHDVIDHD